MERICSNGIFFQGENLSGDFCTRAQVLQSRSVTVQVNAVGSSDFDIFLEESLDGVNWTLVENSELNNTDSSRQPFTFKCLETRFIRACFRVRSGALDVEAFIR